MIVLKHDLKHKRTQMSSSDYIINILFVHSTPLSVMGGAELSIRYHLENTPADVHVDLITPEQQLSLQKYQVVVLGNLRPSGASGEAAEAQWAIDWTDRLSNYSGFSIRSEHDVHPCAHRDGRCLVGRGLIKEQCSCSNLIPGAFQDLYQACSIVRFQSPMHREAIHQLINFQTPEYIIASPIDLTPFKKIIPIYKRKQNVALIMGDDIRIAENATELARNAGYEIERIPYLSVPYGEMPHLYNQYQAIVVAPKMLHAFCRVVPEALSCGCQMITNDRVGAMSWSDPISAAQSANQKFWEMVFNNVNL